MATRKSILAPSRRHDEEVLCADLNANSLGVAGVLPVRSSSSSPSSLPVGRLDQKSHDDETDRARFSLRAHCGNDRARFFLCEDENAIERDLNREGEREEGFSFAFSFPADSRRFQESYLYAHARCAAAILNRTRSFILRTV